MIDKPAYRGIASGSIRQGRVSRREFFHYVSMASGAMLLAEAGAATVWFALPHIHYGAASGVFLIDPKAIPAPVPWPTPYQSSPSDHVYFWMYNTQTGLMIFNPTCTFRGCFYKWVEVNERFECPCCGSKFFADGQYILHEGPARRDLDRYRVTVNLGFTSRTTPANGDPVSLEGAHSIVVDTRFVIRGQARY